MIRTKKNCSVCQTILNQPSRTGGRLARRIYQTTHYDPSSTLSLRDLAREYDMKFSYDSLLNHVKKHQFLSHDDFKERHLRQAAREAEKKMLRQAISSQEVWDKILEKGMQAMNDGTLQVNTTHLLSAARDKSNYEIKHAGQQLALMDMVWGFASGEKLPDGVRRDDAIEGELVDTGGTSDDPGEREERSRSFYESLAWDSPAPGAD